VALLSRQIADLRGQLNRLANALDATDNRDRDSEAQITQLRQQLNTALAARVEELTRYRSDFFGRLREVLGNRPEVRIVGDRFVFQSEVLFPPASAELSPTGERQIRQLARVLVEIAMRIPPEIAWVMRVDGHADRMPIRSPRFATNWELSAARAIAVANLLIQEGLPGNRVAAAAFGENQPLDTAETPEAYARNRRIELRLTDR
jgi:chemotaxis protein MotB